MELLIGGHHGIYIPQLFVQQFKQDILASGAVKKEDLEVVELGPTQEHYWECWETILDNTVLWGVNGNYRLHQTEDLWAMGEDEEWPEDF